MAPSTKPVVKIGLLAPFEGLYRNTGYGELAAMRSAIAESQARTAMADVDILPLALDYSLDPSRAAEKIVADPSMQAVVAPVAALYMAEIASVIAASDAKLVFPQGVGGDEPIVTQLITQLLEEVGKAARRDGMERFVLAGSPDAPLDWEERLGLPTVADIDLSNPQSTDAILWWGSPAEGAAYLNALRTAGIDAPFWMGPAGGNPVFVAHAETLENVYWAIWEDEGYEAWSAAHQPGDPAAYLVYRATEVAIAEIIDGRTAGASGEWDVQFYTFSPDGQSIRMAR